MKLLLPLFAIFLLMGCGSSDQPLPQQNILYKGQSAKLAENDTFEKYEENTTVAHYYIVDSNEHYITVESGAVILLKN